MVEKDPTAWSLGTWALAIGISMAGGFVNWYSKVRRGHARVFNLIELVGEIAVSGFVGLLVFLGLIGLEYAPSVCAAAAGIGGHMGTRLLFICEQWLERKYSGKQKSDV